MPDCVQVVVSVLGFGVIVGCEAKFYDEEQYRKEIYIVSDNSNIFGQEYTFGEMSEGWLSIYAGGTTPIEKDVTVELEHWPEVLRAYNRTTYGEAYANYALQVSKNKCASAFILLGDIEVLADNGGGAASYYDQAILADPKDDTAYRKYALIYRKIKYY